MSSASDRTAAALARARLRRVLRLAEADQDDRPDLSRPDPSRPGVEPHVESGAGTARPAAWRVGLTATHVKALALLLTVVVVAASTWAMRARTESVPVVERSAAPIGPPTAGTTPGSGRPVGVASQESTPVPILQVHVTGEVRRPGVVRLAVGARVHDAIGAAGGTTSQADLGSLNLAAVLTDGDQVVVGGPNGKDSVLSAQPPGPGGTTSSRAGTNLNSATVAQLEELPGVGPVTAAAIVAWRAEHGRFTRVEELQEVDGIGPKTYAKLADLVSV